ncbi:MAG: hypothetical protein ACT6Q8_24940 [Niveispirillum sp.]|uniref:hypothetical protein n=1 Tax=Niveispirillum sp. TaxID=1917217 RepID=UPI0040353BD3
MARALIAASWGKELSPFQPVRRALHHRGMNLVQIEKMVMPILERYDHFRLVVARLNRKPQCAAALLLPWLLVVSEKGKAA